MKIILIIVLYYQRTDNQIRLNKIAVHVIESYPAFRNLNEYYVKPIKPKRANKTLDAVNHTLGIDDKYI